MTHENKNLDAIKSDIDQVLQLFLFYLRIKSFGYNASQTSSDMHTYIDF